MKNSHTEGRCCAGCEDTCGEDHGCQNRKCSCHFPQETDRGDWREELRHIMYEKKDAAGFRMSFSFEEIAALIEKVEEQSARRFQKKLVKVSEEVLEELAPKTNQKDVSKPSANSRGALLAYRGLLLARLSPPKQDT